MIKRRLVGGILSLVVACWELFMAYYYHRMYLFFAGVTDPSEIRVLNTYKGLFFCYSLYAGLALVVGIIFLATCNKQPVKWFEYTLFVVMLLSQPIISRVMAPNVGTEIRLFAFTAIIQFCCYLLGAPGAKGFKDFPFKSKDDAHSEKSIDKLTKLKELLDSGAITQEEFDQEKKKIWK
ncbi:SHOCT domain-containing protein [Lactobacillus delbrueckii]|uniref:SHOCT domain-containing protein n=1 Tax=Lactobacillus delbrueckii TaxID=1584 RepID=UPI001C70268F|nr:SHOCT domain-containing protein [Lactobacillus delbrueckii]MBW9308887.1 SHOCT domain-containing protein [Lactobacillus delbrueckii]